MPKPLLILAAFSCALALARALHADARAGQDARVVGGSAARGWETAEPQTTRCGAHVTSVQFSGSRRPNARRTSRAIRVPLRHRDLDDAWTVSLRLPNRTRRRHRRPIIRSFRDVFGTNPVSPNSVRRTAAAVAATTPPPPPYCTRREELRTRYVCVACLIFFYLNRFSKTTRVRSRGGHSG